MNQALPVTPVLKGRYRAVVIGGSAGSVQVLRELLPPLRAPVPIIVVVHLSAQEPSTLYALLASECQVPVQVPLDKQRIEPSVIYTAPADYHLLIDAGERFALSVGPKVNYSRPSIDMLFESASHVFDSALIGVVVSGANADGANGAARIRECGGLVMVQDPETAEAPQMPRAAIQTAEPQWVGAVGEMVRLLSTL